MKETVGTIKDALEEFKAEMIDQKYALTPEGLGSNIYHVDYEDVMTAINRVVGKVMGFEKELRLELDKCSHYRVQIRARLIREILG